MRKVLVFCLMMVLVTIAQAQNKSALEEVVAAENAFADYAAEKGTKAAFLQFAADDGIIFNPAPANAKEVWSKREPSNALLNWRPNWADVAASGDIGMTTGSWDYRPKGKDDAPVAWGEFFTIWKKQPDGTWKWVFDTGFDHEKAEVLKNSWKSPARSALAKSKNAGANNWQTLESSFAKSLTEKGTKQTYEKLAADEIRLLRENYLPFQGKNAALDFINKNNGTMKIRVLGGELKSDFAYSYGEYELVLPDNKTQNGYFVRVWKHNGKGWQIAADFANLLPEAKK